MLYRDKVKAIKYFEFMVQTQIEELYMHLNNDSPNIKYVNEIADIISICIQHIVKFGFEPEDVLNARFYNIMPRIGKVAKKYEELWKNHNDVLGTMSGVT